MQTIHLLLTNILLSRLLNDIFEVYCFGVCLSACLFICLFIRLSVILHNHPSIRLHPSRNFWPKVDVALMICYMVWCFPKFFTGCTEKWYPQWEGRAAVCHIFDWLSSKSTELFALGNVFVWLGYSVTSLDSSNIFLTNVQASFMFVFDWLNSKSTELFALGNVFVLLGYSVTSLDSSNIF